MAEQQFAVTVAEMHAVALTITEILTIGTFVAFHPTAVAIQHVTVLPDIHEVVLVNIPLVVVGTDTGTGSDGTVGHHGAHADTCLTGEETVAHLTFIIAEETLTAIVCPDATLFAYLFNILTISF